MSCLKRRDIFHLTSSQHYTSAFTLNSHSFCSFQKQLKNLLDILFSKRNFVIIYHKTGDAHDLIALP